MCSAAFIPSLPATCANDCPGVQSPMAYSPLMFVCPKASTVILPLSVFTPSSSNPIPSILATTPTALNKISASKVTSPDGVFTIAFTPVPLVSTFSTSLPVIMMMPCFLNCFSSSLLMSSSSTGTILGINSTTVTFVPILL